MLKQMLSIKGWVILLKSFSAEIILYSLLNKTANGLEKVKVKSDMTQT